MDRLEGRYWRDSGGLAGEYSPKLNGLSKHIRRLDCQSSGKCGDEDDRQRRSAEQSRTP